MSTKKFTLMLCVMLATLFGNTSVQAQENTSKDVTADVNCVEVGRLNGEVQYQYDVTLKNNTASKLIVKYNVIFMEGQVPKKEHKHSTLMMPDETLTETHYGKISEAEWDKVTKFRIEWSSEKQ